MAAAAARHSRLKAVRLRAFQHVGALSQHPSLLSPAGDRPLAWNRFPTSTSGWGGQECRSQLEPAAGHPAQPEVSCPGGAQGLYLVACGWTPPTVPAPSHPVSGPGTPDSASEFLAAIAAELQARGLTVRQSERQGILAEIGASSPAHPERGSVSIGYDGFMVWERWAPAADSDRAAGIVRLIAWLLMGEQAPVTGSAP